MGCGSSSHRIVGFSSRANTNRPPANSNPDPNPNPVYLCRNRTELIRSACDRRYDAAKAHVAYLRSVAALGESLRQFAVNELSTSAPGSPVLTLPTSSKGKSKAGSDLDSGSVSGSSTVTPLSHSLSFEDEEGKLKPTSSTVTPLTHDLSVEEGKRTEEQPQPSTSRKLEEDSRSSPKSNKNMATATSTAMPSPTRNYYPYDYDYANGYEHGYGYGYGFGYETTNSNLNFGDEPGPSEPAIPPVPVQESSGWEFFDPFTNYDEFMERYRYLNSNSNSYHSSPDLNKVRMREGIPDLEDEVKFEEKQKELEKEREEQNAIEREREKQNEIERERDEQKEIERQEEQKEIERQEVRMREGIPDLEDEVKFEEKQKELEKEREEQNAIEREREKQNEIERERDEQKEIERQEEEKQKQKENGGGNDNGIDPTTSVAMEKPRTISTEEGSGRNNKDVRFENEKGTKASTSDNGPAMLVAVEVRDLHDVIEEIKEQFDCVAECAKEVADMLEVGKERYRSGTLGGMFIASGFSSNFFFSFQFYLIFANFYCYPVLVITIAHVPSIATI
jgi:Protein of unknown function (DUF630)/Protein of unknown function (DUF632)